MAQRVQVFLVDDVDGTEADETLRVGLDDTTYELDLNKGNADKLRATLAPYVEVGRKVTGRRKRAASAAGGGVPPSARMSYSERMARKEYLARVREWGREQGYDVPERGRVPDDVETAYRDANPSDKG